MARKSKQTVEAILDPDKMIPQSNEDFLERGWLYYARKQFELAQSDINQVLQNEPNNVDGWYVLGLTLKALGKTQKAVDAFSRIDSVINEIDDHQRATIISRLAHGQINLLTTGNWNLEKEVWKKK